MVNEVEPYPKPPPGEITMKIEPDELKLLRDKTQTPYKDPERRVEYSNPRREMRVQKETEISLNYDPEWDRVVVDMGNEEYDYAPGLSNYEEEEEGEEEEGMNRRYEEVKGKLLQMYTTQTTESYILDGFNAATIKVVNELVVTVTPLNEEHWLYYNEESEDMDELDRLLTITEFNLLKMVCKDFYKPGSTPIS
ncbi:hypothetical protein CYMTET_42587 [Cymbomonas tetramitiformis]|uniref:Uncharacterized protein n=1 Tax=Cymbomonas tetramitiformis TaxID=36881 RepID=A0AAE0F0T8_9CHLO|nr:hypothetical protein CYMTET_42587 [Cymbomonas tetramitiformis]